LSRSRRFRRGPAWLPFGQRGTDVIHARLYALLRRTFRPAGTATRRSELGRNQSVATTGSHTHVAFARVWRGSAHGLHISVPPAAVRFGVISQGARGNRWCNSFPRWP